MSRILVAIQFLVYIIIFVFSGSCIFNALGFNDNKAVFGFEFGFFKYLLAYYSINQPKDTSYRPRVLGLVFFLVLLRIGNLQSNCFGTILLN